MESKISVGTVFDSKLKLQASIMNIIISIAKTLSPWRGHNLRSSVPPGAPTRRANIGLPACEH